MTSRKLAPLLGLLLAACAPLAAPTDPLPEPATNTPTTASTTSTPQPAAALPRLDWPTYQAPTLAPFPLSDEELSLNEPPPSGFPAGLAIPLALAPHDHFYFSFPIANAHVGLYTPSQRYGVEQEAGLTPADPHLGLDVGMDPGTPVRAAAAGTVTWAGYGLLFNSPYYLDDPYGISVAVRHDFGFDDQPLWTVYAHLRQASVEVGQRVERGEIIGLSGNTGMSTGPHLHFEVRSEVRDVFHTYNPELWLAPPEGHGVLVGRVSGYNNLLLLNRLVEVRSLESEQLWSVFTYITSTKLRADPYYKENFVLSNLPAGRYEVAVPYLSRWWRTEVEIHSGAVTYFHFAGPDGFRFELPAEPPLVGVPDS